MKRDLGSVPEQHVPGAYSDRTRSWPGKTTAALTSLLEEAPTFLPNQLELYFYGDCGRCRRLNADYDCIFEDRQRFLDVVLLFLEMHFFLCILL